MGEGRLKSLQPYHSLRPPWEEVLKDEILRRDVTTLSDGAKRLSPKCGPRHRMRNAPAEVYGA